MFPHFPKRGSHYVLLTALCLVLYLPNLGAPSLWDIDEGNNVDCSREMQAADNWRVPTFNYELRVDKPALLYWLQIFAAQSFGVGEFAGRLPSALAAWLAVLVTYELGRRAFGAGAGLIGGVALATAVLFSAAAHFANPDALLCACTVLTFALFWCGLQHSGRIWFVPINAAMALAMLAKGPVGVVLPCAVMGLYLLRAGRLRLLLDRRLLSGILTFVVVALPWYLWVAIDTKFEFIKGFFGAHNFGRAMKTMEGHRGPIFYYLIVLALGFAPWSVFLLPTCVQAWRDRRGVRHLFLIAPDATPAEHARAFLWGWIAIYLLAFTIAATKLPNYILPIYPAVALLTADMLQRWRRGAIALPRWMFALSLGCIAVAGIGTVAGLFVASGAIEVPKLRARAIPDLQWLALLGIVPLIAAGVGAWCLGTERRTGLIVTLAVGACLVLVPLGVWGGTALDGCKAPRPIADMIRAEQTDREIRIAAYDYFQPSLVFYCRRQVAPLTNEAAVEAFLQTPLQVFLVTPQATWDRLPKQAIGDCKVVGRQRDFYRGYDVVLVTNRK